MKLSEGNVRRPLLRIVYSRDALSKSIGCNSLAGRRSPVIKLVKNLEIPAGETLQVVSTPLGNDARPLGDGRATDLQKLGDRDRLLEVTDDISLEHGTMLTIVSNKEQPWLNEGPLTLVSMKDWQSIGGRISWALEKEGLSRADLIQGFAHRGLKISRPALSKWFNGGTSNFRLDHLFAAADLCKVNARWLATGDGEPSLGISRLYADVSASALEVARQFDKLEDSKAQEMITDMIDAKLSQQDASKPIKRARRSNE